MFPSSGSVTQRPPSLHRVPARPVPRLRRYYGALRLPAVLPGRLRCPSPVGDRPVRLCSLRSARRRPAAWSFAVGQLHGHPLLRIGNGRVSQVPGESSCAYALLSDPGGTGAPGHAVRRHGPRQRNNEGSPREYVFRGSMTRPWHALSTLRPRIAPSDARLASRCWPSSAGWDWLPTGFDRKVSVMLPTSLPPFPGFAWRSSRFISYHAPTPSAVLGADLRPGSAPVSTSWNFPISLGS